MAVLVLVNPLSNETRSSSWVHSCQRVAEQLGIDLQVRVIDVDQSLTIKELQVYDRILIAGGDGTLSRQLEHLLLVERPIGLLPCGTANDCARELGWCGQKPELACQHLMVGDERRQFSVWRVLPQGLDVGWLFINYCSMGFDAEIVTRFALMRRQTWSRWWNRLGYFFIALRAITMPHLSPVVVKGEASNGKSFEVEITAGIRSILVTNINAIMGIGNAGSGSDPSDELLEIQAITSIWGYLSLIFPWFGLGRQQDFPSLRRLQITTSATTMQVDGEPCSMLNCQTCRIEQTGQLTFIPF